MVGHLVELHGYGRPTGGPQCSTRLSAQQVGWSIAAGRQYRVRLEPVPAFEGEPVGQQGAGAHVDGIARRALGAEHRRAAHGTTQRNVAA